MIFHIKYKTQLVYKGITKLLNKIYELLKYDKK